MKSGLSTMAAWFLPMEASEYTSAPCSTSCSGLPSMSYAQPTAQAVMLWVQDNLKLLNIASRRCACTCPLSAAYLHVCLYCIAACLLSQSLHGMLTRTKECLMLSFQTSVSCQSILSVALLKASTATCTLCCLAKLAAREMCKLQLFGCWVCIASLEQGCIM